VGAIRFVDIGDGRRLAQHDDANDVLHPVWSDIYPVQEIDGETVLRCIIVAHADNWEVGVTEDGRVLLGAGEGRVYSMPVEIAKKVSNLLGPAIPDAEVLAEAKRHGRVGLTP
jgi:hypothetical protein